MIQFSCTKCQHFSSSPGTGQRCARGHQMVASAQPGVIGLVVIDEGCDDFQIAATKDGGGSSGKGGVRLCSA